jgi:hypothetical protein
MPYVATSANAKLERAIQHFNQLHAEIETFRAGKPYTIRSQLDREKGEKVVTFHPTAELSPSWPIMIGEILYHARSALDHVVFDLSRGVNVRCEFPIFNDKAIFYETGKNGQPTRRSGLRRIAGISHEGARALIESVQPFNTRQGGTEFSVLWLLHELGNIDKHRTLHLCRREADKLEFTFRRPVSPHLMQLGARVLKDGTELMRYKLTTTDEEVDVEVNIALSIALDEGGFPGLEGEPVTNICSAILAHVAQIVGKIERIAP